MKSPGREVSAPHVSSPRGTVLIVDDDADTTHMFATILQFEGYHVVTASDGETGIREILKARPDAILLDLRMPAADGLTFLRQVRASEQSRDIPVAIITGDLVEETLAREFRRLDAVVYFKPLWLEDLVALAERLTRPPH